MKYLLLLFNFALSCSLTAQVTTSVNVESYPPSYIEDSIMPSFKMVHIPAGSFTMGCTSEQQDCDDYQIPTHQVALSGFYMGEAEVTVGEFRIFINETAYQTDADKNGGSRTLGGSNWDWTSGVNWRHDIRGENLQADNQPVIHVSWNDVMAYIAWLNKKCVRQYRLPTEAEWEYAAREGGKAVMFGNGKNILDPTEANFDASAPFKESYSVVGTYRAQTTPVKTFKPNSLGLYDMAGNVWEWCSDWSVDYSSNDQINPTGPSTGSYRVNRGGGWLSNPDWCFVYCRGGNMPDYRDYELGFRLASSQ